MLGGKLTQGSYSAVALLVGIGLDWLTRLHSCAFRIAVRASHTPCERRYNGLEQAICQALAGAETGTILQGFGDVGRLDDVGAGEVGNGTGELENAVEGEGGKLEALGGGLKERLRGGVHEAVFANLRRPHVGVAGDAGAGEALRLTLAGGLYTGANIHRALAVAGIGELFILDAGYLDVDIDSIQQGAGETFLVAGDGAGRAGAFPGGVAGESTRTPVQLATQPKWQSCVPI